STTCVITGLMQIELLKYVLNKHFYDENSFKNWYIDLSASLFVIQKLKFIENKTKLSNSKNQFYFTEWDTLVINNINKNITINEFVQLFPKLLNNIQIRLLYKYGNQDQGNSLYNSLLTI